MKRTILSAGPEMAQDNALLREVIAFVNRMYKIDKDTNARSPCGLPVSLHAEHQPTVMGWSTTQKTTLRDYVVSSKADGTRQLVGFFETNKGSKAFFVDRDWNVHLLNASFPPRFYEGTLLDVERIDQGLNDPTTSPHIPLMLIFDVIALFGKRLSHLSYMTRLQEGHYALDVLARRRDAKSEEKKLEPALVWLLNPPALSLCRECHGMSGMRKLEMFQLDNCLWAVKPCYMACMTALVLAQPLPFATDGLVYTPTSDHIPLFRSPQIFKWKPSHQQTVDFAVLIMTDKTVIPLDMMTKPNPFRALRKGDTVGLFVKTRTRALELYASTRVGAEIACSHPSPVPDQMWICDQCAAVNPTVSISCLQCQKWSRTLSIFECMWDVRHFMWRLIKLRTDKGEPNAKVVADDVVQSLVENVKPWTWWT